MSFNEKAYLGFPVSFNVSNKTCPELVQGTNFQQNWLNENELIFSNEFLIVKTKMKFSVKIYLIKTALILILADVSLQRFQPNFSGKFCSLILQIFRPKILTKTGLFFGFQVLTKTISVFIK